MATELRQRGPPGFDPAPRGGGLRLRVDLQVAIGQGRPAEQESDAEERAQRERRLDEAVGRELEALAAEDAWNGPRKAQEDPYAPKLVLRTDRCDGVRHVVVGVTKRNADDEDVSFEFHKRTGG